MTNTNQNRPAGGNASGRTTSAWRRAIAAAFPHTIPVLTGYLVLGAAYGVLMQSKGFGAPWVLLMSAVAFCGSMQFAAITLLTSAFDPLGAFIMSVMVNARHLFYGVSMLEKYRGLGGAKPILIYTLSDETFSVVFSAEQPPDVSRKDFYLAISLLDYAYWVGGSLLGSLVGQFIRFDTTGLDFALTGLFVVLFIEQISDPRSRASAASSALCVPLRPGPSSVRISW